MTVPTTTARRVVDGNGVGTTFATDFVFLDEDSLIVTIVQSDGDEILQVLNTDYTVTGGDGSTGSVVMSTAPASGETLVIEREEEYLQETDLLGGDPFNASTIETQFDKIVMMIQQLLDLSKRAILAPKTRDPDADNLTLPEPVTGQFLVGNDDASGWDNTDLSDTLADTSLSAITVPVTIANGGTGQQLAASMQKGNYLATTGSGGAYAATSTPAATSLVDGMLVRIEANHTATGSMTFNLDGQGAKSILDAHGASLPNGGLQSGGIYTLSYDAGTDAWFTVGHTRPYVSKLSAVRVYTANTTWSKPDDLDYIEVEAVGGGGSSGACEATGGSQHAAAGGGGGGEYGYARVAAASLSSTETVTIGAAGTAPSAGNNNGNNGGTTSFGSHVTAGGGSGGTAGSAVSDDDHNAGGAGGSGGSNGDFHIAGSPGQPGTIGEASSENVLASLGHGGRGGGPLGGGGGVAGWNTTGSIGGNYGAGGGAPSSRSSQSARAGTAGTKGVVIVKEYTFAYV